MMSLKNKVQLIGHLGADPEIRTFDNGGQVANFSIATDVSYKNKQGEKIQVTDWHNVSITGKLAEVAGKYLKKGSKIAVEGKLKTRSWDDKDGNKRYTTEVVSYEFIMLDTKANGASSQPTNSSSQQAPQNNTSDEEEDDLPF